MKIHWAAAKLVLTTLIMKVSPFVESGLELGFWNSKTSAAFSPMSFTSLGYVEAIMDEVGEELDRPFNAPALAEYFNKGNATTTKQRTLVLFIDGDQWVPHLREIIIETVAQLRPELRTQRRQCTIQLVVFGAAAGLKLVVDKVQKSLGAQ